MGRLDAEMGILAAAGIAIVFMVLALISLVVAVFKRLDDRWQAAEERAAAAATGREQNLDDTTLLIIAAACATVAGGRFKVRRIRRLLSPRQKRTPWSAQGRLILQGSHTVGRKQN
jgi:Na+-transporting methylmalonyl-CoA/oxaloacetate decarboxylase gamma subunit